MVLYGEFSINNCEFPFVQTMSSVTTPIIKPRRGHRIAAGVVVAILALVFAVAGGPQPAGAQIAAQPGWRATAVQPRAGALLKATHIVFDPLRDWLYVALPAGNGVMSNSIVIYNRNGRVGPFVTLGSEPGVLAISDDSQFLYVGLDDLGAVVRVNLDTLTTEAPWSLGNDASCGRYVAADMVVLPSEPHAVAVARNNPCLIIGIEPVHAGVAVFDGGVIRPIMTDDALGSNVIEPGDDPTHLIGLDRESAERTLRLLAVGAEGIEEVAAEGGLLSGYSSDIRTIDGRLYATSGDVVDLDGPENVGQFVVVNNSLPVVRGGRAFFLQYNPVSTQYELHIFDAGTMAFEASTTINGLDDTLPGNGIEFLDTGPDTMAIRLGDGDFFWLKVRLIQYTSFLPTIGRGAPATPGNERHAD